jgi:hypothetical protein
MAMLKSIYYWLVFLTMQLICNYAYAQESAGNDEGGGGALFALIYLAAIWAYPANKWRLWKIGFSIGAADKDTFIDAMKWTGIAILLTVIPLGLLTMCSK